MSLLSPLARLGRATLGALAATGRFAAFAASGVSHIVRPPFYPREFLSALMQIGWFSLPAEAALGRPDRHGSDGGFFGGFLNRIIAVWLR